MGLKLPEPPLRTAAFAASAAAAGAALGNAAPILAHAAGEPRGREGLVGPTASAATGALAGSPPLPGPQCGVPPLRLRCPDLVMSAPYDLHVDRTTIPGRVLLRAASSINNRGRGPLEIRAHRGPSRRMLVYQAVYDRRHRPRLFRSAGKLVFKHVPGARYGRGNVSAASYWKFEHAAAFELWSLDPQGRARLLVRTGPKIDYCLRDLVRKAPSSRSPKAPVYPACSRERRSHRHVLGTSVGWSDVYPYEYPQQWIDVTGLRGRFAYVQIADPEHLLIESSRSNDVSETYIALPSGRVLGHRVAVSTP